MIIEKIGENKLVIRLKNNENTIVTSHPDGSVSIQSDILEGILELAAVQSGISLRSKHITAEVSRSDDYIMLIFTFSPQQFLPTVSIVYTYAKFPSTVSLIDVLTKAPIYVRSLILSAELFSCGDSSKKYILVISSAENSLDTIRAFFSEYAHLSTISHITRLSIKEQCTLICKNVFEKIPLTIYTP